MPHAYVHNTTPSYILYRETERGERAPNKICTHIIVTYRWDRSGHCKLQQRWRTFSRFVNLKLSLKPPIWASQYSHTLRRITSPCMQANLRNANKRACEIESGQLRADVGYYHLARRAILLFVKQNCQTGFACSLSCRHSAQRYRYTYKFPPCISIDTGSVQIELLAKTWLSRLLAKLQPLFLSGNRLDWFKLIRMEQSRVESRILTDSGWF